MEGDIENLEGDLVPENERRINCILHSKRLTRMEKKVDDLHKIFCGNGKIGLCAKVDILWTGSLVIVSGVTGVFGLWLWAQILK